MSRKEGVGERWTCEDNIAGSRPPLEVRLRCELRGPDGGREIHEGNEDVEAVGRKLNGIVQVVPVTVPPEERGREQMDE